MVAKTLQALAYWPITGLLKFFVKYEVKGQEHLTGIEDKAIIFASNHCSYVDGPICAASVPCNDKWYPKKFFPIRFPVTERFFKWYFLLIALFVRMTGCVKLTRNGHALKHLISAVEQNHKVWYFPEGGWDDQDMGRPGKAKAGIAFLQKKTGAIIVPVGINGNFGILSWRTLFRKNKIIVNIGKPMITLDNPGHCTPEEGAQKVMEKIKKLIEEVDNE